MTRADVSASTPTGELWSAKAYPLGATYDDAGTNFALFSYNFGQPDSRNDEDSAASMPKSLVINPYFD